jgi:putative aminopeptidase FrvX
MDLPEVNTSFLLNFLSSLLNLPSPTGMCEAAIHYIETELERIPDLTLHRTRKGALLATWRVVPAHANTPARALTAHVDTLGAMVKEVKANGRLRLSKIGGYAWNTVEGEGCKVFTASQGTVRGSLLLTKPSVHVYGAQVNELKRDDENMELRLDARTSTAEETLALGIRPGDYVAFDPRVEITNGFVRSRHLDDKACAACLVAAIGAMAQAGRQPARTTHFLFSNFEEVGHGAAAGIPADVDELLCVDMAAIGESQSSDEFHVSLCAKDAGGPYHQGLTSRLRGLAEANSIPYKVDIYTYYHSDGAAYLTAGADVAVALIGPGVDASHNYERTHTEALVATTRWVEAYLLEE